MGVKRRLRIDFELYIIEDSLERRVVDQVTVKSDNDIVVVERDRIHAAFVHERALLWRRLNNAQIIVACEGLFEQTPWK
jgi:hypothetical protein